MLLEDLKSVKTPNVQQIAAKHKVDVSTIKAQLRKGIKVELEHTTNKSEAREITLDHLAEYPDYYDRLAKVEQ